ncbi:MAG TPA: YggT family protein [Methylovorus sp.]|nr:YggT family protein [Methylovorus sp.]
MIANALHFLLGTILGMFTLAALLRFYLQLTGAPFKNPASQFVVAITNFAVKPLRRVVPGWGGLDISTLIVAFIAQLILKLASLWLDDFPLLVAGGGVWIVLAGLAIIELIKLSIYIFLYAVILQAILSWVNPYTVITPVLDALTRPILAPLRNRVPLVGGFDLTPILIFIIAQLLLMLFVAPLELQLIKLY